MIDLNTVWFLLLGVLLAGYAILDGFDLGVGVLHAFARGDEERRVHLNAIGPVWDGNEVWLLCAGGALFAAFPPVYACVFSGFYLAFMLLLAALILRAVAIEFRSKLESARWRRFWDRAFFAGSLVSALLYGVALGNILRGLPVDRAGELRVGFLGLLNPLALLVGALSVAMLSTHGALYLRLKSEGALEDRLRTWTPRLLLAWGGLHLLATAALAVGEPQLFRGLVVRPLFWLALVVTVASLVAIPLALRRRRPLAAFFASSMAIAGTLGLVGVTLFPRLVPSSLDPAWSLTVYNAAASPLSLRVMLVIALAGMPLVIAYTVFIHRVFRGKVGLTKESY